MEIHAPCGAKFDLDEDEVAMLAAIRAKYADLPRDELVAMEPAITSAMLDFFSHVRFRRVMHRIALWS